jgi:predicted ATP-grasp superfamily ATP-dependent carboligase
MAARNGVNLPEIAYRYLVQGARPAAVRYTTSVRWLCLRLDYRAFHELAARAELNLGGWLRSLLGSRKVYDLFSWTDPLPALRHAANRLSSWLQRRAGVLRLRLREWLSTAL